MDQETKPAAASEDPRVVAVRADRKVGRGTCSYVDETMTDAELLEQIERDKAKTPTAAVRAMRSLDALLWEHERDLQIGYGGGMYRNSGSS
jgi:uncharacterized protein YigE (DUF2233 family)